MITIEYIATDDGDIYVLPSETTMRAYQTTIASTPKDQQIPTNMDWVFANRYVESVAKLRENQAAKIIRKEYPYKPYTKRQELDARRSAQLSYDSVNDRPVLDQGRYNVLLVEAATKLPESTLLDMEMPLYNRLEGEVFSRMTVNPQQLDFLSTSPGSLPNNTATETLPPSIPD